MIPICQLCNSKGHTAPFCRASPPKRTRCNICGRSNHTSWYCFYNDKGPNYIALYSPQSSFSLQPQSLQYPPYSAPSSQNREVHQPPMQVMQQYTPYQASSSQNREVQQSPMQAMHTVIHSVSPASCSLGSSQVWLTDSGATNHMTADLANLLLASPYPSTETIHIANGEVQSIGRILYKGLCSNGLYPIHSFSPATFQQPYQATTYLGQLIQSILWHHRLGHPINNIVSLISNKADVHVSKTPTPLMCHPCLKGKFSKLPFPQHVNKSVIPFDTIHTNLWGPAPSISVDGYRYYTIFVDECTRYCWIFPLVNKSDLFSTFFVFYSFVFT
ncbi:PREDICTED: uncharacterized protein LOC105117521 [Populus euphratica]|uniref:Uncharacterized protein LOC105117521 n=1 Tax=Populus euphratica TaxID=75702 RepID=A0AAJ6TN16_POPEU|nr:PREDICTED: uncharacterized protein LOC105117521 [Populus euphratica]XP_011013509.1 PREDICTED: uncharacterized protein LOC105117521 [Populus euphratica]XP_011013510.1 PREDICTED: uncharacterized protein LOC105117521 [Populus euphratica]